MSSPPVTGDNDLDAYLYGLQLGIDATAAATATYANAGEVNSTYYPEKYIQIRYADSETGTNISTDQTNKKFYGVYNSTTTTPSNNPADYTWYQLANTFGTTNYLFYTVITGRNLKLFIGSVAPTVYWTECPTTYIDLDVVSDGFIDNTYFADGYDPVRIVSGLPTASTYVGPNIVYDTVTNKLYRWQAGQWYSNVLAADIEGTLASSNFSNSLRPVEVVATLPSSGNFVGRVVLLTTNSKIYRYTSLGWTAEVPTSDLTGQVTSTQITDSAITSDKIAANSVVAGKIATDAVTAGTIAAGAISSDKLAANSVIAGKIAAGAVTADSLSANSVTADKVAANAITSSKISVTDLSSINSNLGSITAGSLNINSKFIVDSSGNTTIQSSPTGARVLITTTAIKVYDSSNVLRVQLGDLTA